jgi:hypothetical protein
MEKGVKIFPLVPLALVLVSLLILSLFAGSFGMGLSANFFNSSPPPRLIYPITDKVVLTGKDFLEFKWWDDFGLTDHFEFRLFKGYNMLASDLIYKEALPARASSVKVKSEVFQDNHVYTWSLMRVAVNEQKSDKSFQSFKVIKK